MGRNVEKLVTRQGWKSRKFGVISSTPLGKTFLTSGVAGLREVKYLVAKLSFYNICAHDKSTIGKNVACKTILFSLEPQFKGTFWFLVFRKEMGCEGSKLIGVSREMGASVVENKKKSTKHFRCCVYNICFPKRSLCVFFSEALSSFIAPFYRFSRPSYFPPPV